jgi:DNA-directed RNA polymerase subunit omega
LKHVKITDELIQKLGGRFQLSSLVQKRLQELNAGARFLVEPKDGETLFDTVLREIAENKIFLEPPSEE